VFLSRNATVRSAYFTHVHLVGYSARGDTDLFELRHLTRT
jgi:hypothetical protein